MKNLATALVALFISAFSFAQTIDEANSYVEFDVGNMGLMSVDGIIKGMSGKVNFDVENPASASFDVCVDPSTVNSDNEGRDDHLKNEDFFNVAKYVNVCFKSSSVVKTEEGFTALGQLTILETTLEVEIPFTANGNVLEGEFEINRIDYGLGADMGSFMVGKKVEMIIHCQLK